MTTNAPAPTSLDRLQMYFTLHLQNEYKKIFPTYKDLTIDLFTYRYDFKNTKTQVSGHFDVFSFDFSKNNIRLTKYYAAFVALLKELQIPHQEKEAGTKPGSESHAHYHSLEVTTAPLIQAIETLGIEKILQSLDTKAKEMKRPVVTSGWPKRSDTQTVLKPHQKKPHPK